MEASQCFETEAGSPTLTVVLAATERMLPWSAFVEAEFDGTIIRLRFTGWELVVRGRDLRELWREFQVQDVRVLRSRVEVEVEEGECLVEGLDLLPWEASA